MDFPEPVISVAVEPRSIADQEKLSDALSKLAQEDPSFKVTSDEETAQTIISGMGELHLEVLIERMKREFKVEANIGKPQVAYRETIKNVSEAEGNLLGKRVEKDSMGMLVCVLSLMRMIAAITTTSVSMMLWAG